MTATSANSPPLRIVIVDDEAPARNRLKDLLSDCADKFNLSVVGEASNGRDALELLGRTEVDLVLLDVRMPEMDGIELAQHLQKLSKPPAIIFTTAYDAYAIQAFEVKAIDYLLKPIPAARLVEALSHPRLSKPITSDALNELAREPRKFLSVQERGRIHLIPINEIVYLKAELKYITIRTREREYLLEESLTKLEQEFVERFVRIHRNCLVAKDSISGFEKDEDNDQSWMVLLEGISEKLPVSRRQWPVVKALGK